MQLICTLIRIIRSFRTLRSGFRISVAEERTFVCSFMCSPHFYSHHGAWWTSWQQIIAFTSSLIRLIFCITPYITLYICHQLILCQQFLARNSSICRLISKFITYCTVRVPRIIGGHERFITMYLHASALKYHCRTTTVTIGTFINQSTSVLQTSCLTDPDSSECHSWVSILCDTRFFCIASLFLVCVRSDVYLFSW